MNSGDLIDEKLARLNQGASPHFTMPALVSPWTFGVASLDPASHGLIVQ